MNNYHLRPCGDSVLRESCSPVEDFSELTNLIDSMYSIMKNHSDCGLAAPQVGDSRQVLIAKIDGYPEVFVNPIIEKSRGFVPFLEGCLSFPGIAVPTIRRYSIDLRYQNRDGTKKNRTYSGMNAIVLQHEIDHLNGRLMFHYFK